MAKIKKSAKQKKFVTTPKKSAQSSQKQFIQTTHKDSSKKLNKKELISEQSPSETTRKTKQRKKTSAKKIKVSANPKVQKAHEKVIEKYNALFKRLANK